MTRTGSEVRDERDDPADDAREESTAGTRRGLLGLLAAAPVLGGLMALFDGDDAGARGRRKRRKKRHKHGKGRRRRQQKRCKSKSNKNHCETAVECDESDECQDPGAPTCVKHKCVCSANGFKPCPAGQLCQRTGCGNDCGALCPPATHACVDGRCRLCDVCDGTLCPYATVLDAINGRPAGSTIRICAGVYTGNVTISKNLTLIGVGGGREPSSNTILDAHGRGSVIVVNKGSTVTLLGLRITGGSDNGAGIRNDGNLTVNACTVTGNTAPFQGAVGGGIQNGNSGTLEMTDCTITDNHADNSGSGGGIANGLLHNQSGGRLTLTNCTVSGNSAKYGGGIYGAEDGTMTLNSGTSVTHNTAGNDGGGIRIVSSTLTLNSGASVTDNTAGNNGGGILNTWGTLTLNGAASVTHNSAGNNGGGINNESPGKVTLNSGASVTDNTAGSAGGGIYHKDAPVHGSVTLNAGSLVCNNSNSQCIGFTPTSDFCGACPR